MEESRQAAFIQCSMGLRTDLPTGSNLWKSNADQASLSAHLLPDVFASLNIDSSLAHQASLSAHLLPDVRHDVLDARVVLEAILREVFAVSRVTETAVRHFGRQWDVGVDPDATEVE